MIKTNYVLQTVVGDYIEHIDFAKKEIKQTESFSSAAIFDDYYYQTIVRPELEKFNLYENIYFKPIKIYWIESKTIQGGVFLTANFEWTRSFKNARIFVGKKGLQFAQKLKEELQTSFPSVKIIGFDDEPDLNTDPI